MARELPDDDPCEVTNYGASDVDVAEVEAMLAQDPENTYLLDLVAFAYYSNEQFESAVMAYEKLTTLEFEKASHHLYFGNCLYRLGRRDEAFREWTLTTKLDTEGKHAEKARTRLQRVFHDRGA